MKICICDDMKSELQMLETLCLEYLHEKKLEAEVVCTQDSSVTTESGFDLLILDIEMPGNSGIDIKNTLFGKERPLILFATSHEENVLEAFGHNVIGFMKKPVTQEDFEFYADQALRLLTAGRTVELERGRTQSSEDIVMFATDSGYTKAILADGMIVGGIDKTLSEWEKELEDVFFIRASSTYLINCKYVETFEGSQIRLKSDEVIKASKRKKAKCFERFTEYLLRNRRFA